MIRQLSVFVENKPGSLMGRNIQTDGSAYEIFVQLHHLIHRNLAFFVWWWISRRWGRSI